MEPDESINYFRKCLAQPHPSQLLQCEVDKTDYLFHWRDRQLWDLFEEAMDAMVVNDRKQIERSLQKLNRDLEQLSQDLEHQVERRTAELRMANQRLQAEIQMLRQANLRQSETDRQQHKDLIAEMSDRHRMEVSLQDSEERYRSVVAAMAEGVVLQQADGQITACNDSAQHILGLTIDQMTGRTSIDLEYRTIHEDGSPFPGETHPSMVTLKTGQAQQSVVMGICKPNNITTWISINSQPLFRPNEPLPYAVVTSFTDITPRKQMEEKLRKSEMNLAEAQRLTHVGNWEFDSQTQKLTWSEELFHIFGYDPHQPEPTLAQHIDAIHPDDQDYWQHTMQRAFLTGESYVIEYRIIRPNGMTRVVEARGEGILDAESHVIRLFGTLQDITEHKQMEMNLRQQAEREHLIGAITQRIHQSLDVNTILDTTVVEVRKLLQADRVLMYQLNPNFSGTVVVESVASGWPSIFQQTITDPCFSQQCVQRYQQGYIKVQSDIYASNAHPCYIQLLAPLQVRALLAVPIFRGELLWGLLIVHQCAAPRAWENWEISLMQQLAVKTGIALQQGWLYEQMQQLNATLEQQVEHRTVELKQASDYEALLKRITDQVRDSLDETQILQTAVQEIALALNVRCCDAGLYNAERTTSTIFCEHTTDFPSAKGKVIPIQESVIHHQLAQGQSLQFCFLVDAFNNVRPNLETFTILSSPILDNQTVLGDLWLFKESHEVFNDMEVRLVEQVANQCAIALRQSRLYQEVQAQVKELARLNSLKDDFLSTVSHELRAPMANIKMATQMLEIAFKPLNVLDDRTQRYLQILKDECQRETDLINDLLDLSRLEMGRAELNLASVNLQCWLPHIADAFQERAEQQQQQFSVAIAPTIAEVTTDLSYLERVLTELLHNACKYTPSGKTIALSAQLLSDVVQIQVTNTGVQIPDEERDRIFEKFYRIPNNDPWKHGGTGLGLALVKKMTELMGASLQLEHCVGQTTFTLSLPLVKS